MTAVVIQNPNRLGYIKRDKKRYTLLRERRRYPALWAKAGAVPSLDLRFADDKSLIDAVTGQQLVTHTRVGSGTFTDSAGTLQTAATNVPRFDHNPTTGESLGLLVEEARTNLLLNSGTLSTQSATVTAVAHTLHFTGTGTITLTGASTAGPLVGTGTGEANRVSLTFTPTAGSLALTVSGTVTNAQLEAGAFRTSYIATAGATATRAADVVIITGSAFSSWYRQDEGSFFVSHDARQVLLVANNNSFNERQPQMGLGATLVHDFYNITGGVIQANNTGLTHIIGTTSRAAYTYKTNDFIGAVNGSLTASDTSGLVSSSASQLNIGAFQGGGSGACGTLRRICFWPQRLPNSTLQSITQ